VKSKSASNGKHTIPAVNKALELVRFLGEENGESTTKALAIQLGVPRTTCYRILRSLVAKNWVRPLEGGRHVLSLGLLPLLKPLRPTEHLAEAVQPVLGALAARSELTAKLTVRQGDYAITVARGESSQQTSVSVRVGSCFHLTHGSSGAVLLSGLDDDEIKEIVERAPAECWEYQTPADVYARLKEFRAEGWCADLGKYRPGNHAVSAPVRDSRRNSIAALTLIGFPHELSEARLPQQTKLLLEAARQAQAILRNLSPEQPAPKRKK
jgi:DNA-binding IclR family transcriptional regulator